MERFYASFFYMSLRKSDTTKQAYGIIMIFLELVTEAKVVRQHNVTRLRQRVFAHSYDSEQIYTFQFNKLILGLGC